MTLFSRLKYAITIDGLLQDLHPNIRPTALIPQQMITEPRGADCFTDQSCGVSHEILRLCTCKKCPMNTVRLPDLPEKFVTGKIGSATVLFNSEKVLPDFLYSLQAQTYKDVVIYAVDNASTDRSSRI